MKIALVHDHLMQLGGAEKVLQAFAEMYPDAPIYTLFSSASVVQKLNVSGRVKNSFLQRLPLLKYYYRALLPIMPRAIESFDLSDYDIIVSSASSFAKGIRKRPGAIHICYCHTPTRYLWINPNDYIESLRYPQLFKKIIRLLIPKLKQWDKNAADEVDFFVANSNEVSKRISEHYKKQSVVVYPPHFYSSPEKRGTKQYFLTGGRLVYYKRFDTAVDAFTRLRLPLIIFGEGPDLKRLKKRAGKTIKFVGNVSDEKLRQLYSEAKAFVHPQKEDFGITAIEAMASGCPVIAFNQGGASESVVHNKTGLLYDEQSWEALADTIVRLDLSIFNTDEIVARGHSFSLKHFKENISQIVDKAHANFS